MSWLTSALEGAVVIAGHIAAAGTSHVQDAVSIGLATFAIKAVHDYQIDRQLISQEQALKEVTKAVDSFAKRSRLSDQMTQNLTAQILELVESLQSYEGDIAKLFQSNHDIYLRLEVLEKYVATTSDSGQLGDSLAWAIQRVPLADQAAMRANLAQMQPGMILGIAEDIGIDHGIMPRSNSHEMATVLLQESRRIGSFLALAREVGSKSHPL